MSFVIPNIKYNNAPIMTDDTGKDLVDEIRRLRIALYVTHDNKPEEDLSIKTLIEDNESYKKDIEEYKDRIRELEHQNKEISANIIKLLDELSDIFTDGNIPDNIDYRRFIEKLCIFLRGAKKYHKRFFKQNLFIPYILLDYRRTNECEHQLEK